MIDQGFIEREQHGDLRDLISRRHAEHATVFVAPEDSLLIAYGRMKLYDISQLPVMSGEDHVVGIIDESDILLEVMGDEARFSLPVEDAMISKIETLQADARLEDLLPIFRADHVPLVLDGDKFLGLITRIDLLNYLRRRMK
jgi:cystathionine beta-synthase